MARKTTNKGASKGTSKGTGKGAPEPMAGPWRTYIRRTHSHGRTTGLPRGCGLHPVDGAAGVLFWTETQNNIPYATLPAVGDTVQARFTSEPVQGHTVAYMGSRANGAKWVYANVAGPNTGDVIVHTVALPTLPDGMDARYIEFSIPLRAAGEAPSGLENGGTGRGVIVAPPTPPTPPTAGQRAPQAPPSK